jgi:hypothetical protein
LGKNVALKSSFSLIFLPPYREFLHAEKLFSSRNPILAAGSYSGKYCPLFRGFKAPDQVMAITTVFIERAKLVKFIIYQNIIINKS